MIHNEHIMHNDFITHIDRYFDGTLDPVESIEYRQHVDHCDVCRRQEATRLIERFDPNFTDPPRSKTQQCLSDSTLRRLIFCELPSELEEIALKHLDDCADCANEAGVYVSMVTDIQASFEDSQRRDIKKRVS